MKKNAYNPYLPCWEYVPDGEPHVFGDRVYVYGSHDEFDSMSFCVNDYVCWSAPVDDLGNWRYEGVILKRTDDPFNQDGEGKLFAPDVTRGPDGRYYLYYVVNTSQAVSVAVCDEPAGKYEFYGQVHYKDGTILGCREGDEKQFDPGVFVEGDSVYLYTGYSPLVPDKYCSVTHGAMATVLETDMLTVKEEPRFIVPSPQYAEGTAYEGHAFFEASSMRKVGELYYFIYSSQNYSELCYAISKSPLEGFSYGGVIINNNDLGIDTYKRAEVGTYYGGNNHGSMVMIGEKPYIFYHRHTNGCKFNRQGCAEPLHILEDGSIPQVEITSCGLNGCLLPGKGTYPAYIACHLFNKKAPNYYSGGYNDNPLRLDDTYPIISQIGKDKDAKGVIKNMQDGSCAGFKYFECLNVQNIGVTICGNGEGAKILIKTAINGDALAEILLQSCTEPTQFETSVEVPDGAQAIYFCYEGSGRVVLYDFSLA